MIEAGESMEQDCVRLGDLLRLGRPVPEEVFVGAVQDPDYARNLFVCREAPPLLEFLLKNPPRRPEAEHDEAAQRSTLELVAKASKSFWEWTKSGFSVVDEETYAKRFGVCLACPNLVAPPSSVVYKLVGASDDRNKICRLCGCVASRKAKLPHEACPDAHPELPGMNRWGEPMPTAAQAS